MTGVAFHPYELDPATFGSVPGNPAGVGHAEAFEFAVTGFHEALVRLAGSEEAALPLWITETGIPAAGTQFAEGGPGGQALVLGQMIGWAQANADALKLRNLDWYNWRDVPGLEEEWGRNCGLRSEDGELRPAFAEFQARAGLVPSLPTAPGAETGAPATVSGEAATVVGNFVAGGLPTVYFFEYGPTAEYGQSTPPTSGGSADVAAAGQGTLTGLVPGTTYHYRLVATNALGTTVGADAELTAPAPVASPAG